MSEYQLLIDVLQSPWSSGITSARIIWHLLGSVATNRVGIRFFEKTSRSGCTQLRLRYQSFTPELLRPISIAPALYGRASMPTKPAVQWWGQLRRPEPLSKCGSCLNAGVSGLESASKHAIGNG
jgi:hypothetical protein